MKPYFQDSAVTLYHADARDVLPTLERGGVDLVLTDPPWGIGYKSGHNSSRKGRGLELTRRDGNFAPIIGDDKPFDPSPLLKFPACILWGGHHFYDSLPAGGTWFVWDKLDGKASFPSGSDCEMAWCSWKGPIRLFTHLWRGAMRAGEENIVNEQKKHPNQKPLALMRWCLQLRPADAMILDPYCGSGTTLVAAKSMGRKAIGVEIEERYCAISAKRLEQGYFSFTEGHADAR